MKFTIDKYRPIFQKYIDALLIVDAKTRKILKVNQATQTIFGFKRKYLEGENFSILFPPKSNSSTKNRINNIKVYGSVFLDEFRRADGSTCTLDLTFTMIPWEKKEAILATFRDPTERIQVEKERENLIKELQTALAKIKTLKGLLPICASCKKIRDDDGYWQQVETYITNHSEAYFSHGICPECQKELYPDYCNKKK
ncbi:MAG: PAS domain S-box protein [bacterium]